MTRAPFATAQRIAFASASTGIEPLRPDDLRDQRARAGGASPAMPMPSFGPGGDQAGDERPVPLRVDGRRARDEALRRGDPAAQLGMGAVDARSRSRPRAPPRAAAARSSSRTHGSGRRTTGAAGRGRSGRMPAAATEHLDVPHTAERRAASRRSGGDAQRGDRREVDDPRRTPAPRAARATAARSAPGASPTANRAASAVGAAAEAEHHGRDERRGPRDHFAGPAGR